MADPQQMTVGDLLGALEKGHCGKEVQRELEQGTAKGIAYKRFLLLYCTLGRYEGEEIPKTEGEDEHPIHFAVRQVEALFTGCKGLPYKEESLEGMPSGMIFYAKTDPLFAQLAGSYFLQLLTQTGRGIGSIYYPLSIKRVWLGLLLWSRGRTGTGWLEEEAPWLVQDSNRALTYAAILRTWALLRLKEIENDITSSPDLSVPRD